MSGVLRKPRIIVATVANDQAKTAYVKSLVAKRKGRTMIFCDWLEQGQALADALDVPFIHGNTPRKLQKLEESDVCVVSRIGDRGISFPDLRLVIEVAGAGSAREQFAQRVGRLLHGDFEGTFITVFTPDEAAKYRGRVFGVEAELAGSVDIEFVDVGNVTAVTAKPSRRAQVVSARVVKSSRTTDMNGIAQLKPQDDIARVMALTAVVAKLTQAQKAAPNDRVQRLIPQVIRYCWAVALSPVEMMEALGQASKDTRARLTAACRAAEKVGLLTLNEDGRYQVNQTEIERLKALSTIWRTN